MPNDPDQQPDPVEKSLGDQATGSDASRTDEERSLGDQSTTGDSLSSMSDLSDLSDDLGDEMPLVDLSQRYEIQGVLGKGGMGEVLRALDKRLKRPVAIKRVLGEMASSKKALSRFRTEAQSIAALNHFNIVQIYDYGRDAKGPFIIMELVEGESLQEKLTTGKLEEEQAINIACQLCDALGKAHGAGIIHRDINPANILLTEDGFPKLTDFGLARQDTVNNGQTQTGSVLGTIDFMSPEQRRDVTATDARSDLWSLAATLYQMVTSEVPRVIDLEGLSHNLRPVISKALKTKPSDRYQTAQDFRNACQGSLTRESQSAVDCAAGQCPLCLSNNELERKFCRGCGKGLRSGCLSCDIDLPVWENFCGECGANQQEIQKQVRQEMKATIEEAWSFAHSHNYDKAFQLANTCSKKEYLFTPDLQQEALEQIDVIAAQRAEQHQLRDQLVDMANQHQLACDYEAVARELASIPEQLRTNTIVDQLTVATAAIIELASLKRKINENIQENQSESLLVNITRYLELKPGHSQMEMLLEKVKLAGLRRQQQANQRANQDAVELIRLAEQQYLNYDDESVISTLNNWPRAIQETDRLKQLRKLAIDRLGNVDMLKRSIAQRKEVADPVVGSFERRLKEINRYLELRPHDADAKHARDALISERSRTNIKQSLDRRHQDSSDAWLYSFYILLVSICLSIVLYWVISTSMGS